MCTKVELLRALLVKGLNKHIRYTNFNLDQGTHKRAHLVISSNHVTTLYHI